MACRVGHTAIVEALLALGADANKQCDGRTPLSLACEKNRDEHLQLIKILTEDAECDPDLPRGPGNPLYLAAYYGHTNVLRALLSAGADPNRPIERKYLSIELNEEVLPGSPLTAAVAANQIGALRVLIEEGHADPNMFIHDRYGMSTAAIWAAYKHRVGALEYLIQHKHVDPNAPVPGDRRLKTVVIAAIAGAEWVRDKTTLFRRLVEIGVDFASFREAGGLKYLTNISESDTQLSDAAEEGNLELIKILVEECGVDVNYQPERGGCALMAALSRCSPQLNSDDSAYLPVLQYLWEKGADLNVHTQDQHGSALALAVSSRQGDVIRWLLDHGADVNLSLRNGWHGSALIAAVSSGEMEMVKMLCDSGANVNLQTRAGDYGSALASAAARGYQEVAMCLLNHRAEINLALRYGTFRCALMAAIWAGEEDMVGFLLDHGANINFCVDCDDHTSGDTLDRLALFYPELDPKTASALVLNNAKSALMVAACGGDEELVKLLIARGADVRRQENQGWEAVLEAARASGRARGCGERTIDADRNGFHDYREWYGEVVLGDMPD